MYSKILILSLLLFSSCSFWRAKEEEQPLQTVSEAPVDTSAVEQPVFEKPAPTSKRSGELAVGDLLDISVLGEEELTESHVAVAPDGRLYYACLEGIPAAGRTLSEVKKEMESALARYFVHPQLDIILLRTPILNKEEPALPMIASYTEYSEGRNPIAIEVSYFPSDAEIAQKIFEQTNQMIRAQAAAGRTSSDLYRLNMEDGLSLAIYGEPSTRRQVAIDNTGEVHFLFLNSIQAKGRTIPELREEIQEQLKSYYQYPVVLVTFNR